MTKESTELLKAQCSTLLKIFEELNPVQEAKKYDSEQLTGCIQKMCRCIIIDKTECEDYHTDDHKSR